MFIGLQINCFLPNVTWVGCSFVGFFCLFIFLTFKHVLEAMSANPPAQRGVFCELSVILSTGDVQEILCCFCLIHHIQLS